MVIPLSGAAIDVLKTLKKAKGVAYVFTSGETAIGGFTKFKDELDEASGVTGWTIYDLRRTARSLMSRAKVPADHAERALGHVIGGVREVYDRHEYIDEKRAAFEALADIVRDALKP